MKKLSYRMYYFVPYNISPIQKGIQSLHAGVEYGIKYFRTAEYQKWAIKDKTVVILDGGTSNDGYRSFYGVSKEIGSMETIGEFLKKIKVKTGLFYEPDLNYMLSGIALLADERVWDKDKYHGFAPYDCGWPAYLWDGFGKDQKQSSRNLYKKEYAEWLNNIGGEKNEMLRSYLREFKLA